MPAQRWARFGEAFAKCPYLCPAPKKYFVSFSFFADSNNRSHHLKQRTMESRIHHPILTQTFNLLKATFVIVPIVAGADKFFNLLTNWEQYVNPSLANMLPFSTSVFMMIAGVIEIVAGLIVLKKPEIGGYIVAGWLALIALTLLAGFNFVDVAVRDLVMAISAFSMARLAKIAA